MQREGACVQYGGFFIHFLKNHKYRPYKLGEGLKLVFHGLFVKSCCIDPAVLDFKKCQFSSFWAKIDKINIGLDQLDFMVFLENSNLFFMEI